MNYIKRLQAENELNDKRLQLVRNELRDLRGYLQSPKFHNDTTVQVDDVLRWLNNAVGYSWTEYPDELL